MDLQRECIARHGVDTNFVGDKLGGTAYSPAVGVNRIDGGVDAMTEALTNSILGGLGAAVSVCLGWAFRINSRVSVVENQQQNLEKWLERVEEKLDRAIERRAR